MVTSTGVDADGVFDVGALAPDGALAAPPDDADEGLDADDGLDAAGAPEAPDAPDAGAAPDCAAVSELELPPLHPPMIAAIATANTPIVKCPFMCGSPFLEGPSPVQRDYCLRRLKSENIRRGRARLCRNGRQRVCIRMKLTS
ncbi:hypothetical protein BSFA1_61260 (plasmid) [Burkholderia sp. SFA1]|nr:hypothetical protein BSFA1_61260 [Burkholderia sp. SFA1]